MSVLRFRYLGKRHALTSGHKIAFTAAPIPRNGNSSGRANTLPARMQPPDFSSYQAFGEEPSSPVNNKGSEYWSRCCKLAQQ
jgi:hypothetical protein